MTFAAGLVTGAALAGMALGSALSRSNPDAIRAPATKRTKSPKKSGAKKVAQESGEEDGAEVGQRTPKPKMAKDLPKKGAHPARSALMSLTP